MPSGYMNEEDKKTIFRKVVAMVKKMQRVGVRMQYLSDKDKVSLGEMVFRSIANEKELNLKSFNGINIAYYHHVIKTKENSKVIDIIPPIRKHESILREDLTSFHLLHQLIHSILEKNPGTTLKFTLKDSKPTLVG
jgi:hypothetical protein